MNKADPTKVATALLLNSGLSGFIFATSFSLRFDLEPRGSGPTQVEVRLDCEWWLGERSQWERRVSELAPLDLPDPEEAVQAFDLVRLRWSASAVVVRVEIENGRLSLGFADGTVLWATTDGPDERWEIVEQGKSLEDSDYAVFGSGEGTFAKQP